jgi:hypothetical protein
MHVRLLGPVQRILPTARGTSSLRWRCGAGGRWLMCPVRPGWRSALGKLYTRGIKFHIGRANAAALPPEVVALIASGRFKPDIVTSAVISWEDAPGRFLDPAIKLVVARSYVDPLSTGPRERVRMSSESAFG